MHIWHVQAKDKGFCCQIKRWVWTYIFFRKDRTKLICLCTFQTVNFINTTYINIFVENNSTNISSLYVLFWYQSIIFTKNSQFLRLNSVVLIENRYVVIFILSSFLVRLTVFEINDIEVTNLNFLKKQAILFTKTFLSKIFVLTFLSQTNRFQNKKHWVWNNWNLPKVIFSSKLFYINFLVTN